MLDRTSLSAKNGWLDEDGKVFIYYKLDWIMADMPDTRLSVESMFH